MAHLDTEPAAWLSAGAQSVLALASDLTRVGSDDLAALAASVAEMVNAATALQAAVALEADERGIIAASDNPRPAAWVEQSCRDAGVPVVPSQARAVAEVVRTCSTPEVTLLRRAVVAGECSVTAAATIASTYRRLAPKVDVGAWDTTLEQLIGWLGEGAGRKDVAAFEDLLLAQYGTQTTLEEEHERLRAERTMTALTKNPRTGMFEARIVMDPVSEAVFSAALHALSKPHVDPDTGERDPRTPGARRLDALVMMATHATNPDTVVRGSGAAARIVVTMPLADLVDGVRASGGCGTTRYGQALSPQDVRMLACDAQIIPAVLGTRGELLDLGRARRLATPGLVTAIELRDETCSYPGCRIPAAWTDKHHLVHWADGGPTALWNLTALCGHHHTVVHRHGHIGTVTPFGVHWSRADGTAIGNGPRGVAGQGGVAGQEGDAA